MATPHPIGPTTTPGPGATLPDRHPGAPAPGAPVASHYQHCFGCGPEHPSGLHLQVRAGEGLTVSAVMNVGPAHQGAPGLAHGGVLAAALDEVMGALNWLLLRPAVTARLETSFARPVPVGTRLVLDARIMGVAGQRMYAAAEGSLGAGGATAVRGSAVFVQVPTEHFRRHGRAQEVATADAQRSGVPGMEVNP